MGKLSSLIWRWRRPLADVEALTSGSGKKVARRGRNRAVGKTLGLLGFWRIFGRLWR